MKQITIHENEAGQRLDKFLHKYLKEAPNSFLYKMLRKKNIVLNHKKACGSEQLAIGDTLSFYLADETIEKFQGHFHYDAMENQYQDAFMKIGALEILFENHHVLLVNKPSGLLTQKAEKGDISLNEWLIGYLLSTKALTEADLTTFKPSVCNRLDRNTSGIVICGKTLPGMQRMNALLKDRSLHKYYRLYAKGIIEKELFLEGSLRKDEAANRVTIHQKGQRPEDAQYVAAKYRPVALCPEMTLLEAELLTGKSHQIRAQLAAVGHPLLGDYKYGDRNWNQSYREAHGVESQMLHAYRLEFPVMDGTFADMNGLSVTARLPEVFTEIWESRQWQHGIQEA